MSATSRRDKLARQATFVFIGTVRKLKSATMPTVPVTNRTVIVHVDQVLQAPKILSGYEGRDITVQLSKGSQVEEGQQAIFYANGWLFGDSIAVQSVGHTEVNGPRAAFSAAAVKSFDTSTDRNLEEHMEDADIIVTGKVVSVGLPNEPAVRSVKSKPSGPRSTSRVSEHSPQWNEAIVDVKSVEKGRQLQKRIAVRFPRSDDVAWARAPKLDPGQEGVFILHKATTKTGTKKSKRTTGAGKKFGGLETYVALHAQDFLPTNKARDISSLIHSPSKKSSKKKR